MDAKTQVRHSIVNLSGLERIDNISHIVIDYLVNNGKFFATEFGLCYYSNDDNTIYNVDKKTTTTHQITQDFACFLNEKTALSASASNIFTNVFQNILTLNRNLEKTRLHRYCYFNINTKVLYLYGNKGKTLVITSEEIFVDNNGCDEVWFEQGDYDSIDFTKLLPLITKQKGELLDEFLLNKIPFEESALTIKQQRILLKVWVYSLFFETAMMTKPIIVLQGASGSGKTYSLKAIGNILFGEKFCESPLPKDERDFFSILTSSYLIQVDNLDTYKADWFEDIVATVTTGASIKIRELYTTANVTTIRPRVFVCISTRNARFTRDDIADRTILFNLKRLDEYDPTFMQTIYSNRYELLAELLSGVQKVITAMNGQDKKNYGLRLVEFARFFDSAIKGLELDVNVEDFLPALQSSQNQFALQNDPLLEYVEFMLKEQDVMYLTTAELFKKFKKIATEEFASKFSYASIKSFGIYFASRIKNLNDAFDIEKKVVHGATKYRIAKKGSLDVDNTQIFDSIFKNDN